MILYRGLFIFCFILNATTFADENFLYQNRKKLDNPNDFFRAKIEGAEGSQQRQNSYVLVFDFNTEDSNLAKRNIIHSGLPSEIKNRSYSSLNDAEKKQYIFSPFLALLRQEAGSKVVHVDHHYDIPMLSQTSTTVLLHDFVMWLHSGDSEASVSEVKEIAAKFENGYAIRDHSDADITLAHLIARNASNVQFLKNVGPYIKAAAIFNDYLRSELTDPRDQSLARILFAICLGVEKSIAKGLDYEQGLALLKKASTTVANLSKNTAPQIINFETYFQDKTERLEMIDPSLRDLLADGLKHNLEVQQAMRAVISDALLLNRDGKLEQTAGMIPNGSIRIRGKTLVINLVGAKLQNEINVSNSDALIAINSQAPELLDGIDLVVSYLQEGEKTNVKFRSINPGVSLEPLFEHLRADHPNFRGSGGRPAAGATSKSGFDTAQCSATFSPLDRVLNVVGKVYANQ